MPRKRHTPEQIIGKLYKAEVGLANGQTVPEVCRVLGISEQTYFRWRKEYGGLRLEQARRLKELERENQRLRRAVADLTLDKLILKEAAVLLAQGGSGADRAMGAAPQRDQAAQRAGIQTAVAKNHRPTRAGPASAADGLQPNQSFPETVPRPT